MKQHKNICSYIGLGLLSLTIFSGAILSSPLALADNSATNDITINVPISCNLSSSTTTNHTATVDAGTYRSEIGESTITATCNDSGGFAIYSIGYTGEDYGDNTLKHTTDSTTSIASGTATSGATSNWAMKLTAVTGTYEPTIETAFQDYTTIPTAYTKVASHASVTDQTNGASFKSTYAAYIAPTQYAGTYEGKVKYTLVHPSTESAPFIPSAQTTESGKICYYPNTDEHEGTMGCQTIPASGTTDGVSPTSATLLASNFSRTGYGFAGWNDKFDYSGTFYGPNETISFTEGQYSGANNGLSLYAVWVQSQGSLQDSTKVATLCGTGTGSLTQAPTDGTANLSSVSALTDQRDNQTYAIAKLADGNCWMIENLRLEAENTRTAEKQALAQGYGTSFGGLADAENKGFTYTYSANSLYYSGTQSGDATINIGTANDPGYRMPRYNNINTSTRASSPTNNSGNMYSYGNYYTWHAAIADLTYNGINNRSTTGTSLCPTGWHLPTGGMAYASGSTSGVNVTGNTSTFREFYNLGYKTMDEVKTAYEDTPNSGNAYYSSNTTNTAGKTATTAFRSFPNNFLYSGRFATSSANMRGLYGYYWSSTAYVNISSYNLSLNSSYVRPGTNDIDKYYGQSIRCLAL